MEGILGLLTFFIDVHLSILSSNYETSFRMGKDALDEESFAGALRKEKFVFSGRLQEDDLSLVSADQDLSIGHPRVAGVLT